VRQDLDFNRGVSDSRVGVSSSRQVVNLGFTNATGGGDVQERVVSCRLLTDIENKAEDKAICQGHSSSYFFMPQSER
jgi:hypothetical protein